MPQSPSISKLKEIVVEANGVSVKRMLSTPTCPVQRSTYCHKRFSMVNPCNIFRTHWMGIIERLHIADSQTDALLAARTAALEKLRVIYEVCNACGMHICSTCGGGLHTVVLQGACVRRCRHVGIL